MQTAAGGPIHYSRTMDTDNLSKAANYVGGYVLKGLGALGKFLNAGFTSPTYGTIGQVSYARNAKDAKRLRKLSEASEQALGKAMTWVSPLNYGAALMTRNGLNAKKGEEEVASWSPAWLAAARLGELYVGPKAVKGVKATPRVVVNTAAKAGVKPAKAAVVVREIKLATKNKPNIEVPKPIIRTKVGDVEIDNPGLYYHQSDAGKAKNFVSTGRMRTPLEESWLAKEEAGEHIPIKIRSGIIPGYPQDPGSVMFAQGKLWYGLTPNKPDLLVTAREMPIANKNASVMSNKASLKQLEAQGTRRVTNDNIYTQGPHNRQNTTAYTWVPEYGYRLIVKEPLTSLKFFERKPFNSKLKKSEEVGVPKGDRNNKKIINPDNVYGNLRFIRNIDGFPTIKDGLVQLGNSDKLLTNFTTDLPFRLHDWYPNIPGSTYMVVSPRAFKGKKFYSIKPSDSFLSTVDSKVTPNQVRIISGDPKILAEAERRGMRTLTSDKLQDLFNVGSEITKKEFELGRNGAIRPFANADVAINDFKFRNRFYGEDVPEILSKYPEGVVTPYRAEVDKLITQNIGRPSAKDYLILENMTGLDAGIINKFDSELIKKAKDPLATRDMFEKVYYPVTSQIEEKLMNSIGLYPGPYYSFSNLLKLDKLKGNPIKKKQGGKMNILEFLKNGGQVRKMQTAAGGPLRLTPAELKYLEWSKMTPELKREYRTNRAKSHLLSGPNITNFWEAFQTYIGNRDPENPHLNTGEAPNPGMRNPRQAINIVKKTPSIILSYKKVVPRFIKKVKEFNGANKILRTISAASKLISPTYTKTLAKSPELVDLIPLWGFKNFNTKLLQNFLKVWETEAAKGPYSLKGLLQYDNSPDKIGNLSKHFEEARKLQRGIDLGGRYGRLVSRKYQQMYDLITDPTLKHIADTSPLYIPELFLLLKNFGGVSEGFLKELIKRSNSYRRYMTKPGTAEDFKTFKGSGLIKGEGSQINVEGKMRSDFNGEYGSYPGYYEGLPNLEGDISTWWDLRVPLGVDVKLGIWTENPTIVKLRLKGHNYDPNSGSSAIELEFWKNYTAPKKFIDWPTHQVFFGTKGSQLLNFNVTTEMPKNFIFGKGYKQGGKMNIIDFLKNGSGIHIKKENRGKFTDYCGGKVTSECIAKGKRSSNPAIRKRATFAANARKWKHKDGGSFKGYPSKAAYDVRLEEVAGFKKGGKAFINGVSILDSNPDAYKYVKKKMKKAAGGTKLNNETILTIGKTALNGILGFIQTSALNNNLLKLADALKAQNKVQPEDFLSMMDLEVNLEIQNEMEQAAAIKAMTGLTINVNPDMARNKVWKRVAENYSRLKRAIDDLNKAIDALVEAQKQSTWGNLAGGLILSGIGLLGNYLGNKNSTNSNNSGAGWTMNYNSLYGNKNNYNTFFLTGSLPKMSSVAAPNTSWLNNNPLLA